MGQYLLDVANVANIIRAEVAAGKTTQPVAHTNLTPNQLEQLTKHQCLVIDDFLPSHFYTALQYEVKNTAHYREAQIVSGLKPSTRSDSITWIERSNAKLVQGGLYMDKLEQPSKALMLTFCWHAPRGSTFCTLWRGWLLQTPCGQPRR